MSRRIIFLLLTLMMIGDLFSIEDERTISVINKYNKINPNKLMKMGDVFLNNNINDSAMICYSLIYNNTSLYNTPEYQKTVCKALNKASTIYFYNCDYHSALELLLRGLALCEEIHYKDYIGRIYNNMGNVYYQFKNYNQAKKYYDLAYKHCVDNHVFGIVLNNLGLLAHAENNLDSALILYRRAHSIRALDSTYSGSLHNIGLIHETLKNYDSALFYYRCALNDTRRFKSEDRESRVLSDIGSLYLSIQCFDSALYYTDKSSIIASRNNLLDVMSDNFLILQSIEERRGNFKKSLDYYKQYFNINDSLFNISTYNRINELQFRYDIAKVDRKIKELSIEQVGKERTIVMQRRQQVIISFILVIVTIFLIILYLRKKTLNKAYNVLFDKNIEIVKSEKLNQQMRLDYEAIIKEKDVVINELNQRLSNNNEHYEYVSSNNRSKRILLSNDFQNELINSISEVMNDSSVFCDPDFSIEKLSDMVNSNKTYVSQIINDIFGKNFRSFINEYRIKEARRMFSELEHKKYSIETISAMVGFKSKSQFNIIFKEVTGVTPSFYVKSLIK